MVAPSESIRFPEEACSVCGAFGAWGWGPPSRPLLTGGRVERRCDAHRWPEWTAKASGGVVAAPPPPQDLQRPALQGDLLATGSRP